MPRAMWSGAISFGLVNVPIKMFTAARSQDVRFNQLHEPDMSRIRMKKFCAEEDEEVPPEEIVRGYDVGGDHYVVIGGVTDLEVQHEGGPLVFFRGGYGRFAV